MNKLDSIYFQAIATAAEGQLEQDGLIELHKQALKFRTLEILEESARYYERLFQIWRTLKQSGAEPSLRSSSALFKCVFSEYLNLLNDLQRRERAGHVEEALKQLTAARRLG